MSARARPAPSQEGPPSAPEAETPEALLERLRAVADAAPVLLSYVDAQERYRFVNRAFEGWFSRQRAEVLGRTVREALGESTYEALRPAVRAALAGQRVHFERPLEHGGTRRHIDATYVPHLRPDGTVAGYVSAVRDVTELRRLQEENRQLAAELEAERQLPKQAPAGPQQLLAAVLDQLPVGVLIAEAPSGRLVLGNRQLDRLWRHAFQALGDLEGWPGWRGWRADGTEYAPHEWPLARALASGECVVAELIRVQRGDGSWGEHEVSAAPVRDGSGQVVAAVATLLDVTDRLRAEEAREQAARFREQFIGVVSHDLRNPLSAIVLSANALLHSGALDERQGRAVARIARSASGMERMIRDLLDFTRVRLGGGFPLQPEPTHLERLCAEVLEELEVTHPTRELRHQLRAGPPGPWDGHRLAQVVGNLVGNALHYSPEHTPVRVSTWPEGGQMLLEVHNQGPPIDARMLPHLFEPFRRGAVTPGRQGLGLGLYIAQQIVQAHGGRLTVRSSQQEGTTFRVSLPLAATSAPR